MADSTMLESSQRSTNPFDYNFLDSNTRKFLLNQSKAIQAVCSRNRQDAHTIGQILLDAHAKLEHGTFCKWIKHEFNGSTSTAYNHMNLARAFEYVTITNTDLPLTILYELARPTVSTETRDKILVLTETQKLSRQMVREIIAQQNIVTTADVDTEAATATIDIPSTVITDQPSNLIPFKRRTRGSTSVLLEMQSAQMQSIQQVCSELIDYFSEQEASVH